MTTNHFLRTAALAITFLLPFLYSFAQAPDWTWAKSSGGTAIEQGNSVATDANGNVFVTGGFASPTLTFGTTILTNVGSNDMFLVKYDASGKVLWAKSAGGTSVDISYSVATDTNGNVLVTGDFFSPSLTFGTTTLTSAGDYDMFVVKYDGSGNILWAKSAGGNSSESGKRVASDANGNVFVTGDFFSPSLTFGTTTLTSAGGKDMFIVKYDESGNVLWAKSPGGTDSDYGYGVATDTNGNVFVTGIF